MSGGVNGFGVNLQNPVVGQPQGQVEQAEAAGAQRPTMFAGLRRFLLAIMSLGRSERGRGNHRIEAAQPPQRHVAPDVPNIFEADVNRANAALKTALSEQRLPDEFLPVKDAALKEFKTLFGEVKVEFSAGKIRGRTSKMLFGEIQQGNRITQAKVQNIFKKTYVLEFLIATAGAECERLVKEKEGNALPGMDGVQMATQLLSASRVVAEKIDAADTPEAATELVEYVKGLTKQEVADRLILFKKFQQVKDDALEELKEEGGVDEKVAKKYLAGVGEKDFCSVTSDDRDEETGYIKKEALNQAIAGMAKKFREKKIEKPLSGLQEINKLELSEPSKKALQESALSKGLRSADAVKLVCEVAQKMDASGIASALKSRSPKASIVAKALEAQLVVARKVVANRLAVLQWKDLGADVLSEIYTAIGTIFFNSHPEISELVKKHVDVFVVADEIVQKNVENKGKNDDAGVRAEAVEIFNLAVYFMESPEPRGMHERSVAMDESCKIARVLQERESSSQYQDVISQLTEAVKARHSTLRQRFGTKQLAEEPFKSVAWMAARTAIIARVDAGEEVNAEAVADAYEKEVRHEIVQKALSSTAQKAARKIGLQGNPDLHGFAAGPALDGVTTPQELAGRLESLKALVQQEVSAQKALADESARLQDYVFEQLVQKFGRTRTKENVVQLVGSRLGTELQTQCSELIRSAPRMKNGALGADADCVMTDAMRQTAEDFLQEHQANIDKILAMGLDPAVTSELLDSALRGDGVVTTERVKTIKALIDGTDVAPIKDGFEKELVNTAGCIGVLRNAVRGVMDSLKAQVGGLEVGDLQLFSRAILSGLMAKEPGLTELLNRNVDAAGRLLVSVRKNALLIGNQDARAAAEEQMVLDFVTMVSSEVVLKHAESLEKNQPILSLLANGRPGERLSRALNNEVRHLRQCFGSRWVEENWPLTGSAAWSRTREAIRRRAATSNDVLTEADIASEYAKQARLVILEARMTQRTENFLTTNKLERLTKDSAATMAKNVMSHRRDAFELVQQVRTPADFDQLVQNLNDAFRKEVGHQCGFFELREASRNSILAQFAEASGLAPDQVGKDLNMGPFNLACNKIFNKVARDPESGNIAAGGLQEALRNVDELVKTFCGGRLKLMEDVVADEGLSAHVKAVLKENVLKVTDFNQPGLLAQLKTELQGVDVAPLTALLAAGGDDLGTKFLDALTNLMKPVGMNFANFVASLGGEASQDILYLLFSCFVTMLLDAHPDLKKAVEDQALALAPANSRIYDRIGPDGNLSNEEASALRLCAAFFQNDQLPKLVAQTRQVR